MPTLSNTQPSTSATILEVPAELEQLAFNLDRAGKLLDELESRLSPVLAVHSEPGQTPSTPEPVRVPLAQALYVANDRLVAGQRQLQSILDRIQF